MCVSILDISLQSKALNALYTSHTTYSTFIISQRTNANVGGFDFSSTFLFLVKETLFVKRESFPHVKIIFVESVLSAKA